MSLTFFVASCFHLQVKKPEAPVTKWCRQEIISDSHFQVIFISIFRIIGLGNYDVT